MYYNQQPTEQEKKFLQILKIAKGIIQRNGINDNDPIYDVFSTVTDLIPIDKNYEAYVMGMIDMAELLGVDCISREFVIELINEAKKNVK